MVKYLNLIIIIALFLGGCASAPKEELDLARRAVSQAYAAGASALAPEEYQAASEALQDAENLIRYGNYKLARKVLPQAATHGFRAVFKAREERVRIELEKKELEEQRKREEVARQAKLAKIEAQKKKARHVYKKRKPVKKKPTLLTRFEVKQKQSLWAISSRVEVYNDPLLWPAIYKANRDQIKDPRRVYPGQVLTIPRKMSENTINATRKEALESRTFPDAMPQPSP